MKDRNGNELKVGDRVLVAGRIQTASGTKLTVELDEADGQGNRRVIEVESDAVDQRDVPAPGEARAEERKTEPVGRAEPQRGQHDKTKTRRVDSRHGDD